MLGARAAAAPPGDSATRWKRGAKPPKPTLVQTKRPTRLLIDDLTMHLRPYACVVDRTIVIMGDLITGLVCRTGCDNLALETIIGDLGLVSCAGARWPANSCVFKTYKGNEAHGPSHIDYILISEHSAMAVPQFGIDADRDGMVDFDHAVLFADIGMCQVLRLKRSSPHPQVPVRRKSKIRYSDKPSVAQFREFADSAYVKRRIHECMNKLIGGLVLDAELAATGARDVDDEERRGWDQVHWRAAGWPDIGLRGRIELRVLDESASETRDGRAIRVHVRKLQARPRQVEPEARWRRLLRPHQACCWPLHTHTTACEAGSALRVGGGDAAARRAHRRRRAGGHDFRRRRLTRAHCEKSPRVALRGSPRSSWRHDVA